MRKSYLVLLGVLLLIVAGCGSGEAGKSDLKPVKFVLDWTPNTNHTGIYVAQEKGYFKDEGLDVEIMLPGEAGASQLVATGKADFGINYQESIMMARNEGLPIVSIAAIMQHNTAGFASPVEKGITKAADFEGKVYGSGMDGLAAAIMKTAMEENGADFSKLEATNIGTSDYFVAVKRDIDFSLVFQGWTGIEAEIRGEELNMIYMKDLSEGLDFYTPVIATNEKLIVDNPELAEKFIRAAVKGYEFAVDNPAEAAEILIKAEPDLNEELVEKSQAWISEQYIDDASSFGVQEMGRWEAVRDFMLEHELIEADFDVSKAFTSEFLPKK